MGPEWANSKKISLVDDDNQKKVNQLCLILFQRDSHNIFELAIITQFHGMQNDKGGLCP